LNKRKIILSAFGSRTSGKSTILNICETALKEHPTIKFNIEALPIIKNKLGFLNEEQIEITWVPILKP